MRLSLMRPLSLIATLSLTCGSGFSQTVAKSKTEPGLELAVNWKWWVAPSEKAEWGMPLPESLMPKTPGAADAGKPAVPRSETYVVKKGDALIKIAKKFDMSAAQLKQFNELKDDRIQIGQVLRIPTLEQLLTLIPPPPPPKAEVVGKKDAEKPVVPDFDADLEARQELENVRLQVFLDRENFSPGVIDGKTGATFLKISELYQQSHPDAATPVLLKAKAEAALKQPYTTYTLRAEDFKFIKLPTTAPVSARGGKKGSKPETAPPTPVTIDEWVAADFLGYASGWEFVAERFHCDEAFLRQINPQLKEAPVVGAEFQVPNVIPFEIEKALDAPLQPTADPKLPVTAAVVLVSRLEILRDGKLIAVMPLSTARPGLRGRDKWTVLDAIPQPRLATKREPREVAKPKPVVAGDPIANPEPAFEPPLETEQFLAPGPNNPVGILWLNLAKAGSSEPLPYGLHGTSVPSRM
ncbi:LysM peptidoglycan-binding domain-containing protein, partial [bacterium]|nr:LysM peptidoglycan-binding domain-containing protein [bacterium]